MRKRSALKNHILLLNGSYEPMDIITVKQFMRKFYREDTTLEVVKWSSDFIHTFNNKYPVPSVVRLTYYINIVKKRSKSGAKRLKIYIRDKWKCSYCLKKLHGNVSKATLDHVMPKSRGGADTPDNLVTSCKPCNNRKGDRTPSEAKMTLHVAKSVLTSHLDVLNLRSLDEKYPEWSDYLFKGTGDKRLMHTDD